MEETSTMPIVCVDYGVQLSKMRPDTIGWTRAPQCSSTTHGFCDRLCGTSFRLGGRK